jgi:hypothetical protein
VGGVPPGWCKQGRRQCRGRCGGVPAGWEGFLQDGADRGVDSAEEDVEVFAALDLYEGEELVGLHSRLLLFSVPCNHSTRMFRIVMVSSSRNFSQQKKQRCHIGNL